jgi:hypothetical protein
MSEVTDGLRRWQRCLARRTGIARVPESVMPAEVRGPLRGESRRGPTAVVRPCFESPSEAQPMRPPVRAQVSPTPASLKQRCAAHSSQRDHRRRRARSRIDSEGLEITLTTRHVDSGTHRPVHLAAKQLWVNWIPVSPGPRRSHFAHRPHDLGGGFRCPPAPSRPIHLAIWHPARLRDLDYFHIVNYCTGIVRKCQ